MYGSRIRTSRLGRNQAKAVWKFVVVVGAYSYAAFLQQLSATANRFDNAVRDLAGSNALPDEIDDIQPLVR